MLRYFCLTILFSSLLLSSHIKANSSKVKTDYFGIELSPFGSFGFNYFDTQNGKEISTLFFIISDESVRETQKYDNKLFDMRLHYRLYKSENETKGIYGGIFGVYTELDGKLHNDTRFAKVKKFGMGLEVGFRNFVVDKFRGLRRIFSKNVYFGASIQVGHYFSDTEHSFETTYEDMGYMNRYGKQNFIDVEILKVGYRF